MRILFLLSMICLVYSCEKVNIKVKEDVTILVQPFKDISSEDVSEITRQIKEICPNVKVLKAIDFPKNAYYKPRNRYRADSIIRYLRGIAPKNSVLIALTDKDISVTKGGNADFGVMGLAFQWGSACIASSYRLNKKKKNEQHFKVAIHELGHTQGLPHCPEKMCFMRDAKGSNPTDEETDFCPKCKSHLKNKNWNFY